MTASSAPASGYAVVLPIKSTQRGKSRLALPAGHRQALALAMALDTARAAAAASMVSSILVVAEDEADARELAQPPQVQVMLTTADGLNPAIVAGLDSLAAQNWLGPVAVLLADLPGLTPAELDAALTAARGHRAAAVADAQGSGTTMLTAERVQDLLPAFGPDSFAAHLRAGAVGLELPASSGLRRDVDELPALVDQGRLVGAYTRVALRVAGYRLGVTTPR